MSLIAELLNVPEGALVDQIDKGIVSVLQAIQVHRTDLFAVAGAVGVVEGIVFQRNYHFLVVEADALQCQGGVAVLPLVLLLVIHAVKELEGEVVLGLGHLDDAAVGHGDARVALARTVIVNQDVVHHAGFLVPAVHPQDVALDTVVEGSGGDFDLTLGAADVVAHGVDLVDGVGDQAVADIEGADTDEDADANHGQEDTHERDARRLDGGELEVLAHIAQGHHGAQEGGQRNGQRQHLTASPHQEFQDYLEFQALTNQFIDVQPKELHDQYEYHNPQDRQKRSHKGFQ